MSGEKTRGTRREERVASCEEEETEEMALPIRECSA